VHATDPPTEAEERRQKIEGWLYPSVTVVAGLALGLAVPDDNSLELPPSWLSRVSSVLGWTYFVAWSLTFYPQVRAWPRRPKFILLYLLHIEVFVLSCRASDSHLI